LRERDAVSFERVRGARLPCEREGGSMLGATEREREKC